MTSFANSWLTISQELSVTLEITASHGFMPSAPTGLKEPAPPLLLQTPDGIIDEMDRLLRNEEQCRDLRMAVLEAIEQSRQFMKGQYDSLVTAGVGANDIKQLGMVAWAMEQRFIGDCNTLLADAAVLLKTFKPTEKTAPEKAALDVTLSIKKSHRNLLEAAFQRKNTISVTEIKLLAEETGLSTRQIRTWFNNARSRRNRAEKSARGIGSGHKPRLSGDSLGRSPSPMPSLGSRSSSGSSSGDESIWIQSGSFVSYDSPVQQPKSFSPEQYKNIFGQTPLQTENFDFATIPVNDTQQLEMMQQPEMNVFFPTDVWSQFVETAPVQDPLSDKQEFLNSMDWLNPPILIESPPIDGSPSPTNYFGGDLGLPQLFGDIEMAL